MSNAREQTEIVINILTALSAALKGTAEEMQAEYEAGPKSKVDKALKAVIETPETPTDKPTAKAAIETPEDTAEVTLKTLRPLALAKVEAGKKAEVQAAIKKYTPSGKLTLVKEEDYTTLFTELEVI